MIQTTLNNRCFLKFGIIKYKTQKDHKQNTSRKYTFDELKNLKRNIPILTTEILQDTTLRLFVI